MPNQALMGLSKADVEARRKNGQVNRVNLSSSRSLTDILKANLFSIANFILLVIMVLLVVVGKPFDALVTGGVVVVNIIFGAFQEYKAKRKLDQIALLSRPKISVIRDGNIQAIDQEDVVVGDYLLIGAGDQAVVDGKLLDTGGDAAYTARVDMDESLLTGESDLIAKYPHDEILSGSFCVVGRGVYIAERVGEASFAQKLTTGARQYTVRMTPLQKQISIIVRGLVVGAIALTVLLGLKAAYHHETFADTLETFAVAISLIPQGLLLMITVAYALGATRIAFKGVLVQQINAIESLSHVDTLCLDKTGTLTTNRILFHGLHPLGKLDEGGFQQVLGDYIASTGKDNRTGEAIAEAIKGTAQPLVASIPFSSARKWAAASFDTAAYKGCYVLGAPEMVMPTLSKEIPLLDELAKQGLRVLVFAHSPHIIRPDDIPTDREADLPSDLSVMGLISFSDELRPSVQDVLGNFRRAGIQLKLISGDNPVTVAALAYQAGFSTDDRAISGLELAALRPEEFQEAVRQNSIFGRITPEQKQRIVQSLRSDRHYVAMMGDGVNDVLSLKQAQVGIAMEDGSQATRAVADIVLLGNKFEALPDAFLEGQRILNGMNDVTRLFLTRTVYTLLLIMIVGFIGTEFPLTPRHNYLLTSIPVGFPAFFLTAWAKTGIPRKDLLTSVTEFVFPAGLTLTAVTVFVWVLYRTYDTSITSVETSRTVLTAAALIGSLWVVILAQHEREDWHDDKPNQYDPWRILITVGMLVLFVVIMLVPPLRKSMELTTLSWADIGTIAAVTTAWAFGFYLIRRYDILERLLLPNYHK